MRVQGRHRLRWSDLRHAEYVEQKTAAVAADVLRKPRLRLKPLAGRKHLSRSEREAASTQRKERYT